MTTNILKYASVFIVYFIIDVSYQVVFGIPFSTQAQEAAGIREIYASEPRNPIFILIWFVIITIAIVKLAVNPALEKRNVALGVMNGFILGIAAYATLALPNGWSIDNYPNTLVLEILLEGALFAPVAAGVTSWWILRRGA